MTATAEPASSAPSAVDPVTGVQLCDLSNPFGYDAPLWPYFPDVKIERFQMGNGIVGIENVGGQIDAVTRKRVTGSETAA